MKQKTAIEDYPQWFKALCIYIEHVPKYLFKFYLGIICNVGPSVGLPSQHKKFAGKTQRAFYTPYLTNSAMQKFTIYSFHLWKCCILRDPVTLVLPEILWF
jgi:hypothetical protein